MNDLGTLNETSGGISSAIARVESIVKNGLFPASVLMQKGMDHERSADPEPMKYLEGVTWRRENPDLLLWDDLYKNSDISVIKVMMERPGQGDLPQKGFYLADEVRKRAISNILVAVPIAKDFQPRNFVQFDHIPPERIEKIYMPKRIFQSIGGLLHRLSGPQIEQVPYTTIDFPLLSRVDRLEVPDYYLAVQKDFGNPRRDVWLTGVRMPLGL